VRTRPALPTPTAATGTDPQTLDAAMARRRGPVRRS
jgi:hypothetical protein